ncbi:alcohol dehydrogenase catalytic domain-containing protein [Streptomyces sp. NPDC059467]|uniref:alcohol dehydrogenase catalytic domain-containing protein n=1 Tax=Streptomyces sp. NPDC059467 TaxID=3346844 RepID=UPI0036C1A4EF
MCRADGLHALPLRDAVRVSAAPEEVTRVFDRLAESVLTLCHQRLSDGEDGRHGTPGPGATAARLAEVVEVGDGVRGLRPGQLVVVPWHICCGTCGACAAGRTASCERVPRHAMYGLPLGGDFGGLFSDAVRVPWADRALVPLPAGVSARAAASASDNLTDAYRSVASGLRAAPGSEVLVMGGTGSIGVYAVAFAKALGAAAVAYVDPYEPAAVELARGLGAEILEEPPRSRDFRVTVDASGRPAGLRAALAATGPSGHCHSVGIYFQDVPLPLSSMYMKGVTFSTGRPDVLPSLPDVLDLLATRMVDPISVFSDVVGYDDAPAALAQGLRKPLVVRAGH